MSFWCHGFDQNSNENIVRISALKFFVASWGLLGRFLGLPWDLVSDIITKEAQKSFQEAPRKLKNLSGQESLQYFRWFFGQNDDIKKTFRN